MNELILKNKIKEALQEDIGNNYTNFYKKQNPRVMQIIVNAIFSNDSTNFNFLNPKIIVENNTRNYIYTVNLEINDNVQHLPHTHYIFKEPVKLIYGLRIKHANTPSALYDFNLWDLNIDSWVNVIKEQFIPYVAIPPNQY